MTRIPRIATLIVALVLVAACGGDEDAGAPEAPTSDPGGALAVEAGDLYFAPESLAAEAGEVEVTLTNVGAVEHDFVIEEIGDVEVAYANAGESVTGTVTLEPGTYTFYCSIPGHRNAMEGTLEVS